MVLYMIISHTDELLKKKDFSSQVIILKLFGKRQVIM